MDAGCSLLSTGQMAEWAVEEQRRVEVLRVTSKVVQMTGIAERQDSTDRTLG